MEKIESFDFVIEYLKQNVALTTNGKNIFVLKNDSVLCLTNGSSYSLKMDDFKIIHGKDTFYIFKDDGVYIDDNKDEAYYRYYKK